MGILGIVVIFICSLAAYAQDEELAMSLWEESLDAAPVCPQNYGHQLPAGRDVPASFDWRNAVLPDWHPLHNLNGGNFITPAQNQNSPQACSSCWIFAPFNSVEARFAMRYAWNNPTLDLAEQEVLSCNGGIGDCVVEKEKNKDAPSIAYNYLSDTGVVRESCFPYQADDTVLCNERCTTPNEPVYKIGCFKRVTGWKDGNGVLVLNNDDLKEEVYLNGPVYTLTRNGNHFQAVIGWDANGWIMQNSGNDPSWDYILYNFQGVGTCTVALYIVPDPTHPNYCDGCRIGFDCYEDGDLNPNNHCEVCDVSTSRIFWSYNERDCTDGSKCTLNDTCHNGVCVGTPRDCDDGLFCTGVETCDDALGCLEGTPPCPDGYLCDENNDECDKVCGAEESAKQALVYLLTLMGGVVLLKRKKS